jgi:hypothetical protein
LTSDSDVCYTQHGYQGKKTVNYHRKRRKGLARAQRVVAAALLLFELALGQTNLLVCLPGKQNTQFLQECFDTLLGPSHAIVFGRLKDLEAMIPTTPKAAIIAFAPLFDYLKGYNPVLVGKNKKASGEKYFIVAASKEITNKNIAEKKVGVIDLLFKGHLIQFVKEQFNVEIKSFKKVNKEEDLLTMLGLESVEAIIVSSTQYNEIRSNTKLPLTIVATSQNDVGFAVCAIKEGNFDPAIKKALLKSSKVLLREMGLDSWEIPQ